MSIRRQHKDGPVKQCTAYTTISKFLEQCDRDTFPGKEFCFMHNDGKAITTPLIRKQCKEYTAKGVQCSKPALPGKDICGIHERHLRKVDPVDDHEEEDCEDEHDHDDETCKDEYDRDGEVYNKETQEYPENIFNGKQQCRGRTVSKKTRCRNLGHDGDKFCRKCGPRYCQDKNNGARCEGIKRNGERCFKPKCKGTEYCESHLKKHDNTMARQGRGDKKRVVKPPDPNKRKRKPEAKREKAPDAETVVIPYHVPAEQLNSPIPIPIPFEHVPLTVEELGYDPAPYVIGESSKREIMIAIDRHINQDILPTVSPKMKNPADMERYTIHLCKEMIERDGRLAIEISPDGSTTDFITSDELYAQYCMGVQIKTTDGITYKENLAVHAFGGVTPKYKNLLMIFYSVPDDRIWMIPYDELARAQKGKDIKIRDGARTAVRWRNYEVPRHEFVQGIVDYFKDINHVDADVKAISRYSACMPSAKSHRVEFVMRQRMVGFLKMNGFSYHRPIFENAIYDLLINGMQAQEKCVSKQKNRAGKVVGLAAGMRQRGPKKIRPIDVGSFEILVLHMQEEHIDNLYIIPEAACIARNILDDASRGIKGVTSVHVYPATYRQGHAHNRDNWANAYSMRYSDGNNQGRMQELLDTCLNQIVLH